MSAGITTTTVLDRTIDVDGYRLHFRVFPGTEPAVLLSRPEALPKPQRAALRVEAGLPGTVATVRAMPVPHPIPVRVITAGIPWWSTPQEDAAWRASHEHLAASVADWKLLVADKSAHLIPYDQPEILLAAVAELVQKARA
jgi:hypothetical protein